MHIIVAVLINVSVMFLSHFILCQFLVYFVPIGSMLVSDELEMKKKLVRKITFKNLKK